MSKLTGELSYKDWMILKHALEQKVKISQGAMDAVDKAIKGLNESQYSVDEYKKQKKELAEEKATLERITKITNSFTKYIKGKDRQYDSRACDCE